MVVNNSVKCVIVGDGAVGKTCLLISYTSHRFPDDYIPTVFDNYIVDLSISGELYSLNLFDTAGQEDYDKIRPLTYSDTDVFLVCFAVDRRDSFDNIYAKWYPELSHYNKNNKAKLILVATKTDLPSSQWKITDEEAIECANKINAMQYSKCSALTQDGLENLFKDVLCIALNEEEPPSNVASRRSKKKKRQCLIM